MTRRTLIAMGGGVLLPLVGGTQTRHSTSDSMPAPLRIGLVSRTFFYAPLWVGMERGFFEAAGLGIAPVVLDSASACTEGLRSGDLDLAIATPEGVMRDADAGGTLRIIAGNTSRLSHYLIAQPRFRRVSDLRGASIGVASLSEGTTFHVREILARNLLSPTDYELREVGGAPTRARLLKEGTIDAALQSIPWNYLAEDQGFVSLADANDYVPAYQFTTINAKLPWAQSNRSRVIAFLQAMRSGTQALFSDLEQASTVVAREMNIALEHARRACRDFREKEIMPLDLSVSEAGLDAAYAHLHARETSPARAQGDTRPYLDLSFWRQSGEN